MSVRAQSVRYPSVTSSALACCTGRGVSVRDVRIDTESRSRSGRCIASSIPSAICIASSFPSPMIVAAAIRSKGAGQWFRCGEREIAAMPKLIRYSLFNFTEGTLLCWAVLALMTAADLHGWRGAIAQSAEPIASIALVALSVGPLIGVCYLATALMLFPPQE